MIYAITEYYNITSKTAKMKRKRNIIRLMSASLTALLLATSCNNSYPGLDYEPDRQPSNDEDLSIGQTPIKIYTRNPAFFSLSTRGTRGTGPFDNETNLKKYDDAVFHVFAFRAGTGEDGTGGQGLLTMPVDLTMSAYSPTHETAPDRNNQSCLLDGQDGMLGMPFRLVRDAASITGNGEAQFGTLEPMVTIPYFIVVLIRMLATTSSVVTSMTGFPPLTIRIVLKMPSHTISTLTEFATFSLVMPIS